MPRAWLLIGALLWAGCDTTAAVGDRIVLSNDSIVLTPKRCGTRFPQLSSVTEGDHPLVYCPAAGELLPAPRKHRRALAVELLLEALVSAARWACYLAIAIALFGGLIRDPFGLTKTRRILEAEAAARHRLRAPPSSDASQPAKTAPLECGTCRAMLPLSRDDLARCPYCDEAVEVPAEHRELAASRRRSREWQRQATRLWRLYDLSTCPPRALAYAALAIGIACFPLGLGTALYGMVTETLHPLMAAGTFLGALFVALMLIGFALARKRPTIRPTYVISPGTGPSRPRCASCAAPLDAPPRFYIVTCDFCATEHLAVSAQRRERELLSTRETGAHQDVLEATRAVEQALRDGWRDIRRLLQVVIVGLLLYAAAVVIWAKLRR